MAADNRGQKGNINHSARCIELSSLLRGIKYRLVSGSTQDVVINGIQSDSRKVQPGNLFTAIKGLTSDGHEFAAKAADAGAAAIVVQKGLGYNLPDKWNGCVVEVEDSREAYGLLAENYYDRPAEKVKLVGITGTNGKTTITYLLEDILKGEGVSVGVIGTVNYRYVSNGNQIVKPSPYTTPEPLILQGLLAEMVEAGVACVIMEVSSHALAQSRIGNLKFDIAGFTNLSRDHLDYHCSMQEYFKAKTLLFTGHLKEFAKVVVSSPINDSESSEWSAQLVELCESEGREVIRSGSAQKCTIKLTDYTSKINETEISFSVGDKPFDLRTPLVGHYNVDNVLTALALSYGLAGDMAKAVASVALSTGAPGRLQRIAIDTKAAKDQPQVFVDYAHTPDALFQALTAMNKLPHRDLICVFGCGGDRDKGKRPVMGKIAGELADVAIVTDDNPRKETPAVIRKEIVPGVIEGGLTFYDPLWLSSRKPGERGALEIGDRQRAINAAICNSGGGDIILIAGKGHEPYQLVPDKTFFDDRVEAADALLSFSPATIAEATGGKLVNDSGAMCLGTISTDSRTIGERDIFVALKGENFDGHNFLSAVIEKKAGCLVVEKDSPGVRELIGGDVPRVEVDDTLQALGDLAAFKRRKVASIADGLVVGITGSCGKTTVKEMTTAILKRRWPGGVENHQDSVLYTAGNLNNLIGMPHSLMPISPANKATVLEMGMNVPGEIQRLAEIAAPDICCITNVHGVHLEGLSTIEGVADAKEELFSASPESATLIVNLDDERIRVRAEKYDRAKITFGRESENRLQADISCTDIVLTDDFRITFTIHLFGESAEVELHTSGIHNVSNSLAAAAIATAAGANPDEIVAGLSDFRPADRRMVVEKSRSGASLINDTYNANPASMVASLLTLVQLSEGKTVAILGDMLELGKDAAKLHYELGEKAGSAGVDYLAVVGEFREQVIKGAVAAGLDVDKAISCVEKGEAVAWVRELESSGIIGQGDWLLVKASRGLKLETVVEGILG